MNAMKKLTLFFLFCAVSVSAQDKFADIATGHYQLRRDRLVEPQPPRLEIRALSVDHDPEAVFAPMDVLDTKEELQAELERMRTQYAPYLRNVAPRFETLRHRMALDTFDWRVETASDRGNLPAVLRGEGNWETVRIPHFGPPLGRAVTYYRKEVELPADLLGTGSLFICFKGVDYKAQVYWNGNLVGTHTGFFAPFECEISKEARPGKNVLLVKVENDYTTTGSSIARENVRGDKIYAATGLGYDDPEVGWHHCPAGMGIYQDCYLEARADMHVNDIFVRPLPEDSAAEAWIEINNYDSVQQRTRLLISVFGQNFEQTVVRDMEYTPRSTYVPGVGDLAKPTDNQSIELKMGYGVNFVRVPIDMKDFRWWDLDHPWLYQIQVSVLDSTGRKLDGAVRQFGMRTFTMDTVSRPRGMMYLNGRPIRLRGANTMGHLQQCVFKGDTSQLIDDILLAKICNMNYLRLTQRPVQPEIYDMCDRLGLLNQADLPLFGSLRRSLMAEAVKQAGEMERLVRSHPSTIMVSYINERFPNAEGQPQRSFADLEEYERLFTAFDQAVLLANPDRVIKAGDGDYDPPSPGLPDNHCYNGWYNGHGLGLGKMHRGYWQMVKPDWYYACGEFGAEGLDPVEVMYKYYPASWLPQTPAEEKTWNANRIPQAQTHRFHYMWYNTQHSLQDWVDASWEHQRWVTKFTTEAFRRDSRMVSFAIHLFIDAFPSGWMKTIMDVDRQPKPAYFAYRDALTPLMTSLRTDRWKYFAGEPISLETWVCNDTERVPEGYTLSYQLERGDRVVFANRTSVDVPACGSAYQGSIEFEAPNVSKRTTYRVRVSLNDPEGRPVHQNVETLEVFPAVGQTARKVYALGEKARMLSEEMGCRNVTALDEAQVLLIDDFAAYERDREAIDAWVARGGKAVLLELPAEQYTVAGTPVQVENTTMGQYYFASPEVAYPAMKSFRPMDFWFWYDPAVGYVTPLLGHTLSAPAWTPLLLSGNSNWLEDKGPVMAACELRHGRGVFRISEVMLAGRVEANPTAKQFAEGLMTW